MRKRIIPAIRNTERLLSKEPGLTQGPFLIFSNSLSDLLSHVKIKCEIGVTYTPHYFLCDISTDVRANPLVKENFLLSTSGCVVHFLIKLKAFQMILKKGGNQTLWGPVQMRVNLKCRGICSCTLCTTPNTTLSISRLAGSAEASE